MSKRQRTTLTTSDNQVIKTWTPGVWSTHRDNWTRKERQEVKKDLEAAFVQAFIGTCYYCGGSTGPDGKGNQVCSEYRRIQ